MEHHARMSHDDASHGAASPDASNPGAQPKPAIAPSMLREIGLFGGLDEATLEVLAKSLPVEQITVGQRVVSEGDPAREMFVVVGGELEVLKRTAFGGEVRVAMLGPGDWFGEMAIVDVQPRSASVRCLAPSVLLRISAEHVDRLLYRRDLKAYALLVMNIARELSRRLRVADGILAQFVGQVNDQYIKKSNPPPG
jgi:CRP/FNR family cyclic AMP-dependent transcriptional regulator